MPIKKKYANILTPIIKLSVIVALSSCFIGENPLKPDATLAVPSKKNDIHATYLLAYFAELNDDEQIASRHLDNLLSHQPDNLEFLQAALHNAIELDEFHRAKPIAEKIYRQKPDNLLAKIVLGTDAIKQKNYPKAREYLKDDSSKKFFTLIENLINSWTLLAENEAEKAYNSIKKIYDNSDNANLFYIYHYALISDIMQKNEDAHTLFKRAYNLTANSNTRIIQAYGRYLLRKNYFTKAKNIYSSYLQKKDNPYIQTARSWAEKKIKPESIVTDSAEGIAEVFYGSAIELIYSANNALAKVYLRASLQIRPEFEQAALLIAEIYRSQGLCRRAIDYYNKIKPQSPAFIETQLQITDCLSELDQKQQAEKKLLRLTEKYPKDQKLQQGLANFYRISEKYHKAIKIYERIIADKKNLSNKDWLLFYFTGIAYERTEKWPKAEKKFLKALELKPDEPLVLNYLGYSWIDMGINLERALQFVKTAVEARPNNGYMIDSLGWAYFRLQQYDRAVTYLERAILLDPVDPFINDHLGDAYWKNSRKYEAIYQWQKALKGATQKEEIEKIEQKIKLAKENRLKI